MARNQAIATGKVLDIHQDSFLKIEKSYCVIDCTAVMALNGTQKLFRKDS